MGPQLASGARKKRDIELVTRTPSSNPPRTATEGLPSSLLARGKKISSSSSEQLRVEPRPAPPRRGPPPRFWLEGKKLTSSSSEQLRVETRPAPPRRGRMSKLSKN